MIAADADAQRPRRAPVLYVSDLTYKGFDPADLFDLAYLLRSPDHDLRGICLTDPAGEGERVLEALTLRASKDTPALAYGTNGLHDALAAQPDQSVSLIVVGGFEIAANVLAREPVLFRAKVARLFLVGGHVNDYALPGRAGERLAINPRLREQHPERFAPQGEGGALLDTPDLGHLLTSGEGVIWLPRDVCLWRYAAPGVLEDAGPVAEFLLRELFFAHLRDNPAADRYEAANAPVLVSTLPALLLAAQPDPAVFLRLFRAVTARAEVDEATGRISSWATQTDRPNLYAVVGIDGQALGKLLTARLRDRPLVPSK